MLSLGLAVSAETHAKLWLIAGAVLLYAASALFAEVLSRSAPAWPGLRALGHWLAIALVVAAVLAMKTTNFTQRTQLAMDVIFATSIASISLALGAVVVAAPQPLEAWPWQRCWLLLLPAALLVMLAGFQGNLTVFHAVLLLIQGAMFMLVWLDPVKRAPLAQIISPPYRPPLPAPLLFLLAMGLGVGGAALATHYALRLQATLPLLSSGIIVAVGLAPLLVAPLAMSGSKQSIHSHGASSAAASLAIVMLNLCLLLPAVILLWHVHESVLPTFHAMAATHPTAAVSPAPLLYSVVHWRVDSLVLLLLAIILVPAALDRWKLAKAEGAMLIGFYLIYVMVQQLVAMQADGSLSP